jgi:hypothetical protein
MADSYVTLQLDTPCSLYDFNQWWVKVNGMLGEVPDADVSVIEHASGVQRVTVHLKARVP